ncbi:MAG: hypothetical protein ABI196_01900 [Bradyrhizobium sp.]
MHPHVSLKGRSAFFISAGGWERSCIRSSALPGEFIGTFALTFIGADAATVLDPPNIAAIAPAHGLVIVAIETDIAVAGAPAF